MSRTVFVVYFFITHGVNMYMVNNLYQQILSSTIFCACKFVFFLFFTGFIWLALKFTWCCDNRAQYSWSTHSKHAECIKWTGSQMLLSELLQMEVSPKPLTAGPISGGLRSIEGGSSVESSFDLSIDFFTNITYL